MIWYALIILGLFLVVCWLYKRTKDEEEMLNEFLRDVSIWDKKEDKED